MAGFREENLLTVYVTSHRAGLSQVARSVAVGTKLKDLFISVEGGSASPSNYSITVNGSSDLRAGHILNDGDRVAFSPTNVKGA